MVTKKSNSASRTKKLGKQLAQKIIKIKQGKVAVVLGLVGNLGGGKTTFLQGFAKGLGIKEKINSPTFIIMRKSKIQNPKSKFKFFYHIDCYRLQKSKEILDLGFSKMISDPQNIIAIEWADTIKNLLPKNAIMIQFDLVSQGVRKIRIQAL